MRGVPLRNRRLRKSARGGSVLDQFGHLSEGDIFKDGLEREIDIEGGSDTSDQLSGEKGMPAELEEISIRRNEISFKNVAPDMSEELLKQAVISEIRGGLRRKLAAFESEPIELARRSERQGVEELESGRDHKIW